MEINKKFRQNEEIEKYVPKSGEEQNEVELDNLPDKDSLVMIIKMLNKLRRRIEEHSEV